MFFTEVDPGLMKNITLKPFIALFFIYSVAYGVYNLPLSTSPDEISFKPALMIKQVSELNVPDTIVANESGISGSDLDENISEQEELVEPQDLKPEISLSGSAVAVDLQEYLTVQVFSFKTLENSLDGYGKVLSSFPVDDLANLRVEYVQQYYTVRVGKFDPADPSGGEQAHNLLGKLQKKFKSSLLLSAYVLENRIQKVYHSAPSNTYTNIPLDKQDLTLASARNIEQHIVIESNIATEIVPKEIPEDIATKLAEQTKKKEFISEAPKKNSKIEESLNLEKAKEKEIPDEDAFIAEFLMAIHKDDIGRSIKSPGTIFFDKKAAETYIVDQGAQRVVVFGSDYFPENSLGKGRNVESPTGGFIDPDGNVYICQDRTSGKPARITVLNSAFMPIAEYLMPDFEGAESFVPRRGAAGEDGKLYISGAYSRKVLVLDKHGKFIKWLVVTDDISKGTSKLGQTMKDGPVLIKDVETDSLGNVFLLSEETSKVYIFNNKEEFLFTMGKKGGNRGKMSRPNGLAIDEKNRCIYIVDYMRHTILVFDYAGQYRFSIGGRGGNDGWFNFPIDVGIGPRNNLIVADFFNHRVQVFEVTFKKKLPTRPKKLWKIE